MFVRVPRKRKQNSCQIGRNVKSASSAEMCCFFLLFPCRTALHKTLKSLPARKYCSFPSHIRRNDSRAQTHPKNKEL